VSGRARHWDEIYATIPVTELSWYERDPLVGLRLIGTIAPGPAASVVDVGAGSSSLVDHLLAAGFAAVTVLDVSGRALDVVRVRLGAASREVTFVEADLLAWEPGRRYDIWHDRAAFHFLTNEAARDRYVARAAGAVRAGGHLVLATFAEDGPTRCSGLPVTRYSPRELGNVFSPFFVRVAAEREEHVTPRGTVQPFTWVVLRRRPLDDPHAAYPGRADQASGVRRRETE
jgi:SAM-dependent methyltransferase